MSGVMASKFDFPVFFHEAFLRQVFKLGICQAYSGTLTRREIVRANASLGEFRRVKAS